MNPDDYIVLDSGGLCYFEFKEDFGYLTAHDLRLIANRLDELNDPFINSFQAALDNMGWDGEDLPF